VSADPRLRRALELLREALSEDAASFEDDDAWEGAPSPPGEPWLPSATDLLVAWHPEAAVAAWPAQSPAQAWDAYFDGAAPAEPEAEPAPPAAPRAAALEVPAEWLTAGDAQAEPPLPAGAKEEVADALYAFLHALERGDVEAALEQVSDDYHVVQGEREVSRADLRRQLEAFLDPRREGRLRLAPVRIPETIAHPLGVLVPLSLAADYEPGDGRAPESLRLERLAFFEPGGDGRWRLAALVDLGEPA
jgi:hypothetical protein